MKVKCIDNKIEFKPLTLQIVVETKVEYDALVLLGKEARESQLVSGGTRCSDKVEAVLNDLIFCIYDEL